MTEYYCPACDDAWNRAYTCELRCVTCGSVIRELEPFEPGRRFAAEVEEMADA